MVINQLSATVRMGDITTLVGPNGCGKSTLLKGMARLLRPRGGVVLLDGHSIHTMPTRQLARQLGILSQSPTAPEGLTVYELVSQGRFPHQGFFRQWTISVSKRPATIVASSANGAVL